MDTESGPGLPTTSIESTDSNQQVDACDSDSVKGRVLEYCRRVFDVQKAGQKRKAEDQLEFESRAAKVLRRS